MNTELGNCPHIAGFDPASATTVADPWEGFAKSRKEVPVFLMPEYGMWVISRYDDVREALKDTKRFSSASHIVFPSVPEKFRDQLEEFPAAIQLNGMDPPRHTPLRRLAQKAFTPAIAKAKEEEFETLANKLIDGFAEDGEADLADSYAGKFSLHVAASMLGVVPDPKIAGELRQWATDAVKLSVDKVEDEELEEIASRAVHFDRFILDLIEERRADPGEDVVSKLLASRDGDDEDEVGLTEVEMKAMVTQSLVGGIDTTGGLIARIIYTLLVEPDRWEQVTGDPAEHSAQIVEETLRTYGSIRAVGRTTTEDVEVAGVTIPAGSFVLLHVGSASRDDAVFEDAEEFKLDRPMRELNQQLGLGRGTHFCLGAPFARISSRVALETIARRLPDLRLKPGSSDRTNSSLFVVVLEKLEATWDPATTKAASS